MSIFYGGMGSYLIFSLDYFTGDGFKLIIIGILAFGYFGYIIFGILMCSKQIKIKRPRTNSIYLGDMELSDI